MRSRRLREQRRSREAQSDKQLLDMVDAYMSSRYTIGDRLWAAKFDFEVVETDRGMMVPYEVVILDDTGKSREGSSVRTAESGVIPAEQAYEKLKDLPASYIDQYIQQDTGSLGDYLGYDDEMGRMFKQANASWNEDLQNDLAGVEKPMWRERPYWKKRPDKRATQDKSGQWRIDPKFERITTADIMVEQGAISMHRARFLIEMALDFDKAAQLAGKKNKSQQWAAGYLAGQQAAQQGNKFAGLGQQEWRATDDFATGYKAGWSAGDYSRNLPALRA